MDAVELARYLSQLFRMHNLKEFVPFGPQATFFRSLGLRYIRIRRALRRPVSEVGAVCSNPARADLCGGTG